MTSPYLTNAADTITQLRELLSKATPGYWVFEAMLQTPGHGFIDAHKDRHAQSVMENDRDVDEVAIKLEDGLLIVAAVNALPALLDRLAKLERDLAEWQMEHGRDSFKSAKLTTGEFNEP